MTLQCYIRLGLKLVRIHRVLTFVQRDFLKPYIDFCTKKRAASESDFKKKLWKLCVNSCFGKFIESVRKYKKCHIATDESTIMQHLSDPQTESSMILNPNCVLIMKKLASIRMNKPIAIGFTILERSKDFMYNSYYNNIKPKFRECNVIFSDTDSLCLEIKSNTPILPLSQLKEIMDFSNYDKSHPLHDNGRKNQLFYFKDEVAGDPIAKFVGLRAKCYSFVTRKGIEQQKLKGVTKAYRPAFQFSHYLECLKRVNQQSVTQYHIRSKNHQVSLIKATRVAISSYDCNRYMLDCGIHTLAHSSHAIKTINHKCAINMN